MIDEFAAALFHCGKSEGGRRRKLSRKARNHGYHHLSYSISEDALVPLAITVPVTILRDFTFSDFMPSHSSELLFVCSCHLQCTALGDANSSVAPRAEAAARWKDELTAAGAALITVLLLGESRIPGIM